MTRTVRSLSTAAYTAVREVRMFCRIERQEEDGEEDRAFERPMRMSSAFISAFVARRLRTFFEIQVMSLPAMTAPARMPRKMRYWLSVLPRMTVSIARAMRTEHQRLLLRITAKKAEYPRYTLTRAFPWSNIRFRADWCRREIAISRAPARTRPPERPRKEKE